LVRFLLIAGSAVFAASGNLLLKAGMTRMGSISETHLSLVQYGLQTLLKPQILIGIVLYVASFLMWLSLLSMADISVVYPTLVSSAFLIVMVGSVVWFGENLSLGRIIGTLVVAAGITIVSLFK
jgi:bacterial/archaeal transporter family protein